MLRTHGLRPASAAGQNIQYPIALRLFPGCQANVNGVKQSRLLAVNVPKTINLL